MTRAEWGGMSGHAWRRFSSLYEAYRWLNSAVDECREVGRRVTLASIVLLTEVDRGQYNAEVTWSREDK